MTSKQIVMMAGAILNQAAGTADTRHPDWPLAVAQAERALEAAQKAAWQPIQHAPKNERESVLVSDHGFVGEAFWHDGSQCHPGRGQAGWFWESDRGNLLTARNCHPSHFQPLPAGATP